MRLFVALDIPEGVRQAISAFAGKLRQTCKQARWTRVEGAHVTLKFIGEVPAEKAGPIQAALAGVPFPSPIQLVYRGAGFFPNERRPRVFWPGIEAGTELPALAEAVEASLEPLGIARESREFSPHLTLARFDSSGDLADLRSSVAAAGPLEFGRSMANEFHLYQSVLKRGGAEYTRVATFGWKESNPS